MIDKKDKYQVKISAGKKTQVLLDASFGHVNIILGINGVGKSSILEELKEHSIAFKKTRVIYIEGGRALGIRESLAPSAQNFASEVPEKAQEIYESKTKGNLSARIGDILKLLERKGEQVYKADSEMAEEFRKGKIAALLPRETPPLEKLFDIFGEIFKEIKIEYSSTTKKIQCKKNGSIPYSPVKLSDGEKQVFCLIAELLLLVDDNSLILIDEPELNLHPALAIDLWSEIESRLPGAVFIYATHLINFCIRPEVDALIVLSQNGAAPLVIKDPEHPEEIEKDELKAFLGAIPSILTNNQTVVIEGKDNSVDRLLYPWLLKDTKAKFVPVGSCGEVKSAVMRDGVWKALGASLKILGIVDRDFKSVEKIQDIEKSAVFTLPLHEIESILILPKVVCLVAEKVGLVPTLPSESQVEEIILKEWERVYPRVALRRASEEIKISVAPSVSRQEMDDAKGDTQALKSALVKSCKAEEVRVLDLLNEETISTHFESELEKCKKALDDRNIATILALMPPKEIENKIFRLAGCTDSKGMARLVSKHLDIDEVLELSDFRNKIKVALE